MTPVTLPAFNVVGLSVRTSNASEMSGTGSIGTLWGSFMSGAAGRIRNVADATVIYSLYTHYESDETGLYDVVLGKSVAASSHVPEGMTFLTIPPAQYLVFRAENNSPRGIQAAWMNVYRYFIENPLPRRAFTVDFEKHTPEAVELFIAVGLP